MPPKPPRRWVVVADWGRARVVDLGTATRPATTVDGMVFEGVSRHPRDVMADQAGRTFDRMGPGRHAMEPGSDPTADKERIFLATIIDALAHKADENAFDSLILVAPPRVLHRFRDLAPTRLRARIEREIGKDLNQLPTEDLKHRVLAELGPQ